MSQLHWEQREKHTSAHMKNYAVRHTMKKDVMGLQNYSFPLLFFDFPAVGEGGVSLVASVPLDRFLCSPGATPFPLALARVTRIFAANPNSSSTGLGTVEAGEGAGVCFFLVSLFEAFRNL